jgi:hypothetical protein
MRLSTLVGAKLMSRRTGIRILNPDWEEERVDQEANEIGGDEPEIGPLFRPTLPPPPEPPVEVERERNEEQQRPPA